MAYPIERREKDGVTILAPQDRLVLGEPVQTLRLAFEDLTREGRFRIVLDLRAVDYIDSSALGCLVMAHTRVEQAGGAMVIFGLQRRTIELLVITKLTTVFRLAETEADAINLCYPERAATTFDILSFVQQQRKKERSE